MPARKRKTPVAPLPRQACRAGQFAIYTVMCASGLLWSANSTGLTLVLTLTPPTLPGYSLRALPTDCAPDDGVLLYTYLEDPLIGVSSQLLLVRFHRDMLPTAYVSGVSCASALRGRMKTNIHHRPERM